MQKKKRTALFLNRYRDPEGREVFDRADEALFSKEEASILILR